MGTPTQLSTSTQVRIGDKERDECLDLLTQHHVDGRLDVEELNRRHQVALTARTCADLDALLVDLPRLRTGALGMPGSPFADGTGHLPVRAPATPDRRAMAKWTARHGLVAGGVVLTAWLGTKGIDDAAVRQVAWNASWITGACGYFGALLATRSK